MPKTFCVVGHDARQQAAARVLRRAGYGVTAADNAAAADYILLPMSQGRVSDEVARALQGAGQGTLILAGRPGMPVLEWHLLLPVPFQPGFCHTAPVPVR